MTRVLEHKVSNFLDLSKSRKRSFVQLPVPPGQEPNLDKAILWIRPEIRAYENAGYELFESHKISLKRTPLIDRHHSIFQVNPTTRRQTMLYATEMQ